MHLQMSWVQIRNWQYLSAQISETKLLFSKWPENRYFYVVSVQSIEILLDTLAQVTLCPRTKYSPGSSSLSLHGLMQESYKWCNVHEVNGDRSYLANTNTQGDRTKNMAFTLWWTTKFELFCFQPMIVVPTKLLSSILRLKSRWRTSLDHSSSWNIRKTCLFLVRSNIKMSNYVHTYKNTNISRSSAFLWLFTLTADVVDTPMQPADINFYLL